MRSAAAPLFLRRLSSSAVLPPAAGCGPAPRPDPAPAAPASAGTPPRRHADAESASPDVRALAAALRLRYRKRKIQVSGGKSNNDVTLEVLGDMGNAKEVYTVYQGNSVTLDGVSEAAL